MIDKVIYNSSWPLVTKVEKSKYIFWEQYCEINENN